MSTHLTDVYLSVLPLPDSRVVRVPPCSFLDLFHSWSVLASLIEHGLVVHVNGNLIHSDRPLHRLGHFPIIRRERLTTLSGQFPYYAAHTNTILVHLLLVGVLFAVVSSQ